VLKSVFSSGLKFLFLKEAIKFKKYPRKKIEKYQIIKLREIIKYAYRYSPYYRNLLKKNNIKPNSINSLKDLKRIPISSKQDIRNNAEKVYSIEFKKYLDLLPRMPSFLYMRSTSGTTGKPFKIYFDEISKYQLDAIYARALLDVGYDPTKPLLYFWWQQEPKKEIYNLLGFFKKIYVPSYLNIEQQVEIMKSLKPEYIYYYPSHLYFIARYIEKKGIDLDFKPKVIITHAEILEEKMRKKIEEVFDTKVFDQYGSNEFNRIAYECEERDGYHVCADSLILEIVDDEGEEVGEGETGRVIITGLLNKATPLIRYEIGDLAKKSIERKHSKCNNNLPILIESVEGRIEHKVGELTQKDFYRKCTELLENEKEIYKFQLRLKGNILYFVVPQQTNVTNKLINNLRKEFQNFNIRILHDDIKINKITGKCLLFEVEKENI